MYGGIITPPDDAGADFGALFFHKDGFSTACGHGTMALGRWAVDSGVVAAPDDGHARVVIDTPSGRVEAVVHRRAGRTTTIDYRSVPSFAVAEAVTIRTEFGNVEVDLGFGGAYYAHLDLGQLGETIEPARLRELRRLGQEVRRRLFDSDLVAHPADARLSGIYGVVLYERCGLTPNGGLLQRNVTIFADGEVDRSPCGSGTASRVAVLDARGEMREGGTFVHESITGSRFTARIQQRLRDFGRPAVVPVITGTSFPTGRHAFVVDRDDDLAAGFLIAD